MKRNYFKDFMYVLVEENLYLHIYKHIKYKIWCAKEKKRIEKEFAEIPDEPIRVDIYN